MRGTSRLKSESGQLRALGRSLSPSGRGSPPWGPWYAARRGRDCGRDVVRARWMCIFRLRTALDVHFQAPCSFGCAYVFSGGYDRAPVKARGVSFLLHMYARIPARLRSGGAERSRALHARQQITKNAGLCPAPRSASPRPIRSDVHSQFFAAPDVHFQARDASDLQVQLGE